MATRKTKKQPELNITDTRWNNRISHLGESLPKDLLDHPLNYKIHSSLHAAAMRGVLDEIGWIDTIKVNHRSGFIIDGHMRVALAMKEDPDAMIPVVYLDLPEELEMKALAYFDPVGYMYFRTDSDKLNAVLSEVKASDEALQEILDTLPLHCEPIKFDIYDPPTTTPANNNSQQQQQNQPASLQPPATDAHDTNETVDDDTQSHYDSTQIEGVVKGKAVRSSFILYVAFSNHVDLRRATHMLTGGQHADITEAMRLVTVDGEKYMNWWETKLR